MTNEPLPSQSFRTSFLFVLILFAIVYIGSGFSPGLQDDADATHAEAAREMYVTHDFVTLKVNGNRYLEKAPMLYWVVALSYSVFGVNEFATRLPTALAMLAMVLLAMAWARRAFGERASLYAGMMVTTCAGYYLFTRILIPEAILSAWIAGSFYCFLTALEDDAAWRWYGGYACLALSVLTKGLLALVVVGFAMVVFLAVSEAWREWRRFRISTGLILFFVIAAPWHLLAGIRNPGFFWFYFVNEHFMRFLGKRIPKDYNKQEDSLYWSLHLVWLFPWSLYLPAVLKRMVVEWNQHRKNRGVVQFSLRDRPVKREIPPPAGENAGVRDDARFIASPQIQIASLLICQAVVIRGRSMESTISAARSAGCCTPGARRRDFTFARPSIMRVRGGPPGMNSFSLATTLGAVKSCCTSSGTISSSAIRLTMAKRGTLTRGLPSM